jgi:superfamily II DNA/RNA helicase
VKGNAAGFSESLDIKNIDYTFRTAQKSFNEWSKIPTAHISDFIKKLPPNFFRLTDALTVARTRKMITGHQDGLTFPLKAKPQNIFVTPKEIGNFDSFEELFDHFPPMLSGYQPAFYTESKEERKKRNEAKKKGLKSNIPILEDELQRDRFLVKMMYILMVKRLESSWSSFQVTIERILAHHQNALDKIKRYEQTKKDEATDTTQLTLVFEDDDSQTTAEELTLGKKRPIKLSDIDRAGNLALYKKDLKKDLDALQLLQSNLTRFKEKVTLETHHQSEDLKLEKLMECISQKQKREANAANPKVLIFTVYKDTAFYLLDQLTKRGFGRVAAVSGDATRIGNDPTEWRDFESVLERFAPFTKLFKEKQWKFEPTQEAKPLAAFAEWKHWIEKNDPKTYAKLQAPIDILIATDALSEGQNLQDCDLVINYDIHWNPVRVIQRMGRIDRLGSPNEVVFGVNFWPSDNINSYLNLQGRIEQRMAAMQLAGAEVHLEFSDTFREMAADDELEQRQKDRMLEQMQSSWDEIDTERSLGFDDFSLEVYRQELLEELRTRQKYYEGLPNAIYTGFVAQPAICPQKGLIALLGYPARPPKTEKHLYKNHELLYINYRGESVLLNQKEVLESLAKHKNEARDNEGLRDIDLGKPEAIQQLSHALAQWLKLQTTSEGVNEDGTTTQRMGKAQSNLFDQLKSGNKAAIHQIKTGGGVEKKYQKDNFDLIVWFVVN